MIKPEPMNIPEELKDWTDIDWAAYKIGQSIGLFPDPAEPLDFQVKYKHVFWSRNRLGDALYAFINELVLLGIMDRNEDNQVRWVKHYEPEPYVSR